MPVHNGQIRKLYPRADAAVLADDARLSFEGAAGMTYSVRIEDEATGQTVFEANTRPTTVTVATGILRPGRKYYWEVRPQGADQPPERRWAEFHTLGAEDTARRASLRARLELIADDEALGLLAEVDRRLGLLSEAAEGFLRALSRSMDQEPLRRRLKDVEARLDERHPGDGAR